MNKNSVLLQVLLFTLLPMSLRGDVQFWDPDGATVGTSVSGNWDTATANWSATADSGVNTVWTQGNDAVFGVEANYTVTLTQPITVGNITVSGSAGALTINHTALNSLSLGSPSASDITGSRTVTFSAPIGGGFSLTKSGNGTLVLAGANTYSGGTIVSSGSGFIGIATDTVSAGGVIISSALGTGPMTVNTAGHTVFASGGARAVENPVILNAGLVVGGSQNLAFTNGAWQLVGGGRTITISNTAETILASSLTDDGTARTLTKAGPARLIMKTGDISTFLGGVTASAGTLVAGSGTPFPTNNNNQITVNGSTLDLNGFDVRLSRLAGNATGSVLLGTNTLTAGSASSSEFSGVISGTGGYVKVGPTSQVLSGTNSFTGGITITESVVYFPTNAVTGSPIALGPGPNTITITGTGRIGANRAAPSISIVTNNVVLAAGATAGLDPANSGHFILAGQASGSGGFLRYSQGSGFPILAGDNTFTGGVQMDARLLGLGHKHALGTGTLTIGNPTNLPTQTLQLATIVDLIGADAITNPVVVNQDFVLNSTLTNYNSDVTFGLELSGPMTLAAGTKMIAAIGTNLAKFSGVISGDGGITKAGTNALVLTGANTYSGNTSVSEGTLVVNNTSGSGTGTGSVTVGLGLEATLGGNGTIGGPVTVNSGGNIVPGNSAGKLTLSSGLDLSAGATTIWELAAEKDGTSGTAGTDFDQLSLTGGNLVLGGSSALLLQFTGSATFPDSTNSFWQANHTWKIIALSGAAANPGNSDFSTISGTNGISAGTFSTLVDGGGNVILSYVSATPPRPFVESNITGAGTTNATIRWSSVNGVSYEVQYKNDLNDANWSVLGLVTATGSTASITDTTNPPAAKRFYRIVVR